MEKEILDFYRSFSAYTFPGAYQERLQKELPDNVRELGLLVRKSLIHRSTLTDGNVGTNADLRFGDMTEMPWYRQPEDDLFPTAGAILTELYRRDARGIVEGRKVEDKVILTCRYTAILMASILKSKGIPTRVRAGHASYFAFEKSMDMSADHWINQYWNEQEQRWITIDVDGSLSLVDDFDPYDLPAGTFDFPAIAWGQLRAGKVDPLRFWNGKPERGQLVLLWSLFYDFHCLMNSEILYTHGPKWGNAQNFSMLTPKQFAQIDNLAQLMTDPDQNFASLQKIWESEREFRILYGSLL